MTECTHTHMHTHTWAIDGRSSKHTANPALSTDG